MPLIRAIGRFFQRRMSVDASPERYADSALADASPLSSFGSGGMVWAVIMLIALPLLLFLVLIGLMYEVIVHLGGRRLPAALDWLIATAAMTLVVGAGIWWVVSALALA